MAAELVCFTRVIMASAEDMRVLLEREWVGWNERGTASSSGSGHGCTAGVAAAATTAQQDQRRAAAAQAAGVGASADVDTRLLGKPVAFDERETSWRSFKFQFVAYCGAIDSRLKDLLVLAETRDVVAMRNIQMDPDTRALSAQPYCTLTMVCQEGAQKLLEHADDTEGGVACRRLVDENEPRATGR